MARRGRGSDRSAGPGLIDLLSLLPWWLSLVLIPVAWFGLGWLAERPQGSLSALGLPSALSGSLIKGLAMGGQVVVLVLLGVASVVSAWRAWRGRSGRSPSNARPAPFEDRPPSDPGRRGHLQGGVPSSQPPVIAMPDTSRWSLPLLMALEWKRFEEVCTGLFERLGFTTQAARHGADGGIDIRLYRDGSEAPAAIVQCKAWKQRVGVDVVRELRGVMAAERVAEGIFITTSSFTPEAVAFARDNPIDLMDGPAVLKAIGALTEDQQASLLALATAGDFTTPTCASCGVKLVWRTPASGARGFWGCANYPRCRMRMYLAE